MQNYCKTIGALAAASALAAGTASAQVEYEIGAGYASEYLFRGLNLGQDLIDVGVEASTEFSGLGVSAGAWYGSVHNIVGPGVPNLSYDELNLFTEVSKDLGFAEVSVGYIFYHFQKNQVGQFLADQQEIYFGLSRDFGFAEASLTYFWDIEGDNDGYLELGVAKGFELSQCLTLNVDAALGYYVEPGEFGHLTTKISLDYALTDTATVSPFIAGSLALSDEPGTFTWGSKNQFVSGVALKVAF